LDFSLFFMKVSLLPFYFYFLFPNKILAVKYN
jgi:hypothetical protein